MLRREERLGILTSMSQGVVEELETPGEVLEDMPDESLTIMEDAGKDDFYEEPIQDGDLPRDESVDEKELIFQNSNDLMMYIGKFGKLLKVNKAGLAFSGFSEDEVIGKMFWKLPGVFSKWNVPKYLNVFKNALKGKPTRNFVGKLDDKSGKTHVMDFSAFPVKKNKKLKYVFVVAKDITGQKAIESRYRLITENTSDLICTTTFSLKPIYTYVSPSYKKILGYEPEEMIGKNSYDFIHPGDKKNITPILKKYLSMKVNKLLTGIEQSPVEKFENRVIDKSGNWHYVENTANIIGKEIIIVSKDVTERKKAEKVLQESESQKKAILNGITTNIAFVNENLEILWVNKASAISVGKLPEEMIGHKCYEFWADPEKPCDGCPTLKAGKTRKSEHAIMTAPDGRVWDKRGEPVLDQNGELIGMVEIARDITEQKQIEEELAKVAAEQKNIMETVSDGVYMLDLKGNLVSWNREVDEVTGLSAEELMDKPIVEFFAEEDRAAVAEAIRKGLEEGIGEVTGSFLRKGRSPAIYQWSVVPLKDPQGNVIGLTGVGRDITEQKQIEEELAKVAAEQKNIMETVSDGVYMLDLKGNLVSWNREVDEVTGLSAEELMDKPIVEFFAEEDRAAVAEAIRKGLEEGIGEVTGSFLRKGRSPAIYQWSVVPLKDPQGNVIGLTGVGRDITEQKQIEEELAKVAAEQKNIMETVSDGVYMLDLKGNLVSWNREVDEVTGLSAEELMDKPIVEFFAEEDRAAVAEAIRKGLEEGIGEVTGSFLRKGRSPAIYQWSVVPLKDPQGNVIGLTGVGRDITEQKQIEEELAKVAAEQKNIMETVSDGVYMLDLKGNLVSWNREVDEVTGLSAEELMDKPIVEFFAEEDRAAVAEAIRKGLEEGIGEVTGSFLRKGRSPAIYQWSVVPLKDPQGNVIGLTGVGRDITEQKQIEEELAKVAAEQKNIMETVSDGVYMLDLKGNLVSWNREVDEVTGLSAEELMDKPIVEFFAEEDRAAVAEAIRKGLEEGIGEVTGSFLRKGRSPAIYQWSVVPLKDPQGNVIGLTGVGRDITEQKQIEEELAKVAAEQKNIMETVSDGVYMLDLKGNLVSWNREVDEVTGLSAEELMDKPIVEFFAEEDRAAVAEAIRKGLEEGIGEVTGSFLRKGRSPAIYQWSVVPLKDPQGNVIGLTGVGRDITEQKQIEEELAKVAAEQKNIMETVSDGVYMLDLKGNLVSWNREVDEVTGLSAEELMDKPIVEFFAEEDRAAVAEAIRKGLEEGIGEVTGSFLRKGRSPAIYQWSVVPLKDPQGNVIGLTGVGRDITESKSVEKKLKESEEKFKNMAERSFDAIVVTDAKGKITYASPTVEKIAGFTQEECIGKTFLKFLYKPDAPRVMKRFYNDIKNHRNTEDCPLRIKSNCGELIHAEISATPIVKDGKVVGTHGVIRNVTDRKKAEETLKMSERKFREIFNGVSDAVFIHDLKDLSIIDVNDEACRRFGYTRGEMKKMSIDELSKGPVSLVGSPESKELYKRIMNGESVKSDWLSKTKDGDTFWHEMNLKLVEIDGEKRLLAVARDIDGRKAAEKEIKYLKEYNESILESDPNPVLVIKGNQIEYINKSFISTFGKTKNYYILKELKEVISVEIVTAFEELLQKYDEIKELEIKGKSFSVSSFVVKKAAAAAEEEEEENRIGIILQDITERKRAEKALRESEMRIRTIYEAAKNVSFVMTGLAGTEAHILEFSPGAEAIFGYRREEVIGKPASVLHLPEDVAKFPEVIESMRQRKAGFTGESTLVRKSGEKFPALFTTYPLFDVEGKLTTTLGVSIDITERKNADEKIRQQNIKLKKLDCIKTDFLNATSHELRTPMAAIKGYIQMLLKQTLGDVTPEQKDALNVVLRNTGRLDHLVQDILDISRLKSGTMKFIPEKTDISKMIKESLQTMQYNAEMKNIKINTELGKNIPALTIDQERIKQVITNLVDNAIKFSPPNSTVMIRAKKDKSDVLFEVQDFGRGIPKNKQKKIFERFYQVDSGMDRKFGGVGLGLAVSQGIVKSHGGNIWVDNSTEDKGSTFKFNLPIDSVENIEEKFEQMDIFKLENDK